MPHRPLLDGDIDAMRAPTTIDFMMGSMRREILRHRRAISGDGIHDGTRAALYRALSFRHARSRGLARAANTRDYIAAPLLFLAIMKRKCLRPAPHAHYHCCI